MSRGILELVKEWNQKIKDQIYRPPKFLVISKDLKKGRQFLNDLLDGVLLGSDRIHPSKQYSLSASYEFSTLEELQNSCPPSLVFLLDESLIQQIEQEHQVQTILVSKEESVTLSDSFGDKIYEALPFQEGLAYAMVSSSKTLKEKSCIEYSKATAFQGALIGAIPVPTADMLFLLPLQIRGVLKIASIYNHSWNQDRARELIGVLGGGILFRSASRNLAKLVPVLGSVIGASVAFGGTYAILKTAQVYFEKGACLDKYSRQSLKKIFQMAQEEGKDFFSDSKMKEFRLVQLKYKSGAISKDEFEKKMENLGREK